MKKLISILLVCMFFITSCGSNQVNNDTNNNENVRSELEDRTYILGLDDTFAPMGFRDEKGELVGFDIDLAKDAAKRMGIDLEFQPIDWSMKETELQAGNIDFIWNGYSITPEREEKVALSKPYLKNSQIIVVMAGSNVKEKKDLASKLVTVQAESSALDAMNRDQDFMDSLKDSPVEYATNVECFKDIEAGRCDAIVVDEVLARYYIKQNGEENYRVLSEDFGDEEFAVGMRKEDTQLVDALNKAFDEQKQDGKYDEIYKKWFSEN